MFKIDFKNKRVDFFGLATYARKQKLNHKDLLKQAFDQNALIEDNKDLLLNFIESFDFIQNLIQFFFIRIFRNMFYRIISPTIYFPIFHFQRKIVVSEFFYYSTVTDFAKFLGLSIS